MLLPRTGLVIPDNKSQIFCRDNKHGQTFTAAPDCPPCHYFFSPASALLNAEKTTLLRSTLQKSNQRPSTPCKQRLPWSVLTDATVSLCQHATASNPQANQKQ